MPIDPSDFDVEKLKESAQDSLNYAKEIEQEQQADQELQQVTQSEETQAKAEQDDPRNKENWGFKGLVKEGQSILSGGLQDTASSIAT